jgi:hypothetical protein
MMFVDENLSCFHDAKITSLRVNSAEHDEIFDGGLDIYKEMNAKMRHISINYSWKIFQLAVCLYIQRFLYFNIQLTSVFVHDREMVVVRKKHIYQYLPLVLVQLG